MTILFWKSLFKLYLVQQKFERKLDMKLFFSNALYRSITLSRMLNLMGSYLYNIVFVIYAASLPYANTAVFIANIITIIPTLFTFWIGVQADRTGRKGDFMIFIGFIQALLFTGVTFLISNKTFLIFAIICFLNVLTDMLSDYAGGLRMPILQKNLEKDDLFEAYSFTQFITYLCSITGQTVGVWLLATSDNNFALVAIINALSFLASSLVLLHKRRQLTHEAVVVTPEKISLFTQFKMLYQNMELIFQESENASFIHLLLAILTLNMMGGAINSIYNFYFLKHTISHLTYAQSLLIVEVVLLVGAILGSLTPHDYFSKKSFSFLLIMNSSSFGLVGISNLVGLPSIIGILILAFSAYIMGKSTPKLDAMLIANLPSNVLAQSNNFLGLLFTFSLPLGTVLFSVLSAYNIYLCWFIFVVFSLLALLLSLQNNRLKKGNIS